MFTITSITTVMSNTETMTYLSIVLEDSLHVCIQAVLPTQSTDLLSEACWPQEAKFHLHHSHMKTGYQYKEIKSSNIILSIFSLTR